MMTTEEKLRMYREKRQFIHDISMAFIKNPKGHSVDGIIYTVLFKEDDLGTHFSEWLTMQFMGGAEAHQLITCNSNSANFRAVAGMIEGGCYEQNPDYERLLSLGWKKLDLNMMTSYKEAK